LRFAVFLTAGGLIAGGHCVVMTNLFLFWITNCLNVLSVNDHWNRSNRSQDLLYNSSPQEARVANSKSHQESTFYFSGNFAYFEEKIESRKEAMPILST
jgi:hypothetical protein